MAIFRVHHTCCIVNIELVAGEQLHVCFDSKADAQGAPKKCDMQAPDVHIALEFADVVPQIVPGATLHNLMRTQAQPWALGSQPKFEFFFSSVLVLPLTDEVSHFI